MNFNLSRKIKSFPLIQGLKKIKNIINGLPEQFRIINEKQSRDHEETLARYEQLYTMISELKKTVVGNLDEILTIKESLRLHNLEQGQKHEQTVLDLRETLSQHNLEQNQKHEKVVLDLRETLSQHNLEQNLKREASRAVLQNAFRKQLEILNENDWKAYKEQIHSRWFLVDYIERVLQKENKVVKCPICGYSSSVNSLEKRETACIFEGGRLCRFECPVCGCVFGPQKMLELTQEELGEEYKTSYNVFSETDTSVLEKAVFQTLQPEKGKVYLNWGAGAWNSTSEQLRAEEFTIYDYEPYAPCKPNQWLITSEKDLEQNKFDGIFSNDLIEHLPHPVEDLLFMKSLLKDGGSMAHGSGCYEYEFEYTRFHLCFFLGKSLEYISRMLKMDYSLSERYAQASPFRVCKWTMKNKEYEL